MSLVPGSLGNGGLVVSLRVVGLLKCPFLPVVLRVVRGRRGLSWWLSSHPR